LEILKCFFKKEVAVLGLCLQHGAVKFLLNSIFLHGDVFQNILKSIKRKSPS